MKAKNTFLLVLTFLICSFANAQEICSNAIDDDNDGLIDLNDPDCGCSNYPLTSLLPNPSFEENIGCPNNFTEFNFAIPWVQATEATTDYINNCGFIPAAVTDAGLQNFPNGNGIAGTFFIHNWKECMGMNLTTPLTSGTSYQLTFNIATTVMNDFGFLSTENFVPQYGPVNMTIYGSTNGSGMPLATLIGPSVFDSNWVVIGQATYTPQSAWGQITIQFTPTFNVNALIIGSPPELPPSYPSLYENGSYPYILYDNLRLNKSEEFGVNITQNGTFCYDTIVLTATPTVPVSANATYQWYLNGIAILGANTTTYQLPNSIDSLGNYSVMLTDNGNCHVSTTHIVSDYIAGPLVSTVQPNCNVSTGSITVLTSAALYSFDDGVTWTTNPTISNLPVGNYPVRTQTALGCISYASIVGINAALPLNTPNFTYSNPTCAGGSNDGTISILSTASQYSFDGGITWSTNPVATNLSVGNYYIMIMDANGCTSDMLSVSFSSISYPVPPSYTAIQPQCPETTGSITITTSASLYSFDGGANWSTNPTAENLPFGDYIIIYQTANGCISYPEYVNIAQGFMANPDYTVINPNCNDLGGSITITTTADSYSFDGGITWTTNPTLSNLQSGVYSLVIQNNNGCMSFPVLIYLTPQNPIPPNYTVNQPDCLGNLGSITITSPALQYSFDNGITWVENATLSELQPGNYSIAIQDLNGCFSATTTATINDVPLPPLAPTFTVIQPDCFTSTGTITITESPFEYSFDNGSTWLSSNSLNNLPTGTYQIRIKSLNGCISESSEVQIIPFTNYPSPPNGVSPQEFCVSDNATLADIVLDSQSINWYNSPTLGTILPITTLLVNNTIYYASQVVNGCESQNRLPITVIVNPLITPTFTNISTICYNQNAPELPTVSLENISGNWIPSIINTTASGNYTFTPDNGQCATQTTISTNVSNDFDFEIVEYCQENNLIVEIKAINNSINLQNSQVEWLYNGVEIGNGTSVFDVTNFVFTLSNSNFLPLTFNINVIDNAGCGKMKSITLESIYCGIPKGISPNNDDKNDFFDLTLLDVKQLRIFNRFGVEVYSKSNYVNEWKGDSSDGKELPDGVYYYVVELNEGDKVKSGWVYINREL